MIKKLFILIIAAISLNSCCTLFGSYKLGNGFYLMVGDSDEDKIVVYNPDLGCLECCHSGTRIIPNENNMYNENIVRLEHSNDYIILKSYLINKKTFRYWVIEKGFDEDKISIETINESYVKGPLDSIKFYQLLEDKDIDLELND